MTEHVELTGPLSCFGGGGEQVQKIKERVEEKEGIPPVQQRLIFGGKQMCVVANHHTPPWSLDRVNRDKAELFQLIGGLGFGRADDKSASEYNLEGGATLHLVLALRGGS